MKDADVTLKNPRLKQEQDPNRLHLEVDLRLGFTGDDDPTALEGVVHLSGEIGYLTESRVFQLTQPVLEQLAAPGIPDKYRGKSRDAIGQAMTEYFRRNPLYILKADEGDALAARIGLKRVAIERDQIIATLGL